MNTILDRTSVPGKAESVVPDVHTVRNGWSRVPAPATAQDSGGPDWRGLLAVLRILHATPDERIDMGEWCGTHCCAIGLFCEANPNDELHIERVHFVPTSTNAVPTFRGRRYYEAIALRFRIDHRTAQDIFSGNTRYQEGAAAKEHVAGQLIQLIEDGAPDLLVDEMLADFRAEGRLVADIGRAKLAALTTLNNGASHD